MIYSKHRTFGFWIIVGALMLYFFLAISCTTQFYFDFPIFRVSITSEKSYYAWMTVNGIACLLFGSIIYFRASIVIIESENGVLKTIGFKNIFTRRYKIYLADEFDGYITTILWHKQFNQNKTICLIKDGRIVRRIDNFFYSNIDELEKGLKELKYLGYVEMGIVNSWKVLVNRPIVKY